MENDFPKFVKKLQSKHKSEEPEYSGMIFNIFLLHFMHAENDLESLSNLCVTKKQKETD